MVAWYASTSLAEHAYRPIREKDLVKTRGRVLSARVHRPESHTSPRTERRIRWRRQEKKAYDRPAKPDVEARSPSVVPHPVLRPQSAILGAQKDMRVPDLSRYVGADGGLTLQKDGGVRIPHHEDGKTHVVDSSDTPVPWGHARTACRQLPHVYKDPK